MGVQLIEVTHANVAYVCLGGFIVLFSLVSLLVKERLYLGECVLATAFGIAIGPIGANFLNPRDWGSVDEVTLEVMRIVLATGVFAIGVELPKSYLAKHWKSLVYMIVPTMAFGWFASAGHFNKCFLETFSLTIVPGLIRALFPSLNYISALTISACLTPTDPILATAIITGKFAVKNVPKHIRHLLAAESAANDGLAYPFLSIAIYLSIESSKRVAIEKWFLVGWLYQVILGVILGSILGTSFCWILKFAQRRGFIDRESFVAQYLALAVLSTGLANLLGSDDLLTAFAAGSAISWDGEFNVQTENDAFSAILDLILNCAAFVYIGAWTPFHEFVNNESGLSISRLIILGICLLIVRRIPAVLALQRLVPDIRDWREALFCGHFGPIGVGAVYISTLARLRLPESDLSTKYQLDILSQSIQPIVSFIVLVSIAVHGLSIPFFTLGRRVHSRTRSLTQTWTFSGNHPNEPNRPEWLQHTRRIIRSKGGATTPVQAVLDEDDTVRRPVPFNDTGSSRNMEMNEEVGNVSDGPSTICRKIVPESEAAICKTTASN